MKNKWLLICIPCTLLIILIIVTFVLFSNNKTYEDYVDKGSDDIVTIEVINDSRVSAGQFRYSATDECVESILKYECVKTYEIIYVADSVDTWVYYMYCNGDIWYLVEDEESTFCQLEEYLSYDEVLSQIEEDKKLEEDN